MIIAIDGPAASGKGTIARSLSAKYGLRYLDTGLLYRAVAKGVLDAGLNIDDERDAEFVALSLNLGDVSVAGTQLVNFGPPAAIVAAYPTVREALLGLQRTYAQTLPGAVLDGRDIGTVIAPEADVKIFVTASSDVRATRRVAELRSAGLVTSKEDVLADIERRDERDRSRTAAPLIQAKDAHLLDTTHMSIETAVRAAIDIVEATRAGRERK